MAGLTWTEEKIAGAALLHHVAHAGTVEVGRVMYDGSNDFWVWSTQLAEDAWGYGKTAEGAKGGFEAWLKNWIENFRPIFEQLGGNSRGA